MLPIRRLLVLTTSASVTTAILDRVGEADMDAVRIRLEDEKAKRFLMQNNLEVLMLQIEQIKSELSRNANFATTRIAFTASYSKKMAYGPDQTVIFDNVTVNEGNCYNSFAGRFRAPFQVLYILSATAKKDNGSDVQLVIMKDNVEIGKVFTGMISYSSGTITVVTIMDTGQEVYIKEIPSWKECVLGTFTGILYARYN
ncbi:hypothetical protein CHS0354_027798 [Potamilus streckersoni]|uniref:C1q domain-containing protein n=1 Tax=Potamilus streckersoni TaxID=2493646 RepID=A0AAE0W5V8_9BIVA|nr:hypothetical protein CHS0354_027798 [Potamilus streckersoni]